MYVCTFSNLTVTSNPHFSKAYVCMFSVFIVTGNPPYFKTRLKKGTTAFCLGALVFLKEVPLLHFGIGGHKFFSRVVAIMNFKPFDVMVDSKLSLHYSFFCLFYCLLICSRTKMTRLILKVVVLDLSIFQEKRTRH